MTEKNDNAHTDLDVHITASKDELSLKAKGAGLLIILSICISGIIFLGYQISKEDSNPATILPLMFLVYITYSLIATVDALLGISSRHHD